MGSCRVRTIMTKVAARAEDCYASRLFMLTAYVLVSVSQSVFRMTQRVHLECCYGSGHRLPYHIVSEP